MRNQTPLWPSFARHFAKLLFVPALLTSVSWSAQAACSPCSPTAAALSTQPAVQAYRQQSVTLTATVTGNSNTAPPTGSVEFIDNGQVIARAGLDAAGKASTAIAYQVIGSHSLAARYAGDSVHQPSETTASGLTIVPKLAPRIQTIPSPMSAQACQAVTLATSITNGSNPTGTVTFKDGGMAMGPAITLVDGKASYTTAFAAAGTHQVSASYSGDVAHQSSNGTATPVTIVSGAQAHFFNTSGEVPFACAGDSNASLQLGSPGSDPRIVNVPEETGVRNADGGLGYGKVPDPLAEGDGPWIQHRVIRADADSKGTDVKRSEESMSKTLALGDEFWVVFEWFTPPQTGLGQLRGRSWSDIDSVTIFQLHDPGTFGYKGSAPFVDFSISTNPDHPKGYRSFTIPRHTWLPGDGKFTASRKSHWLGGTEGVYVDKNTGRADPNWPDASIGVKEAFAFHIKLHYATGQFYTRAWMAKRGAPVVQILNDTTTPNLPDIGQSGGSAAAVAYIKNGMYAYDIPNDRSVPFDWRTMKRRFQVLRNQHGLLTSTGLSEDAVAAQLIRQAQAQ
jgi:hypothetical protein